MDPANRAENIMTDQPSSPSPNLFQSLIPVIALISLLVGAMQFWEDWTAPIPLILATGVAVLTGLCAGYSWQELEEGLLHGIAIGMKSMLILCVVGVMIGTWIAGGIVPTLIYYGLQVLHPSYFYLAACLICCVVSLSTGSSWVTAATIGVALIGVAQGLEISLSVTAGAVISGSYFGDKMSPLSDTTNLAAAATGSELFEHIRHMLYTTVPAITISLVLFALLGWQSVGTQPAEGGADIPTLLSSLSDNFRLSPWLLSFPLLIVLLVFMKLAALPALFVAALLGAGAALWIQESSLDQILNVAHSGYQMESGNANLDRLLKRGGLESMMSTVLLIICALGYGGVMERCGFLKVIVGAILHYARSVTALVAATVGTCLGMNVVTADQYVTVVTVGRMYREEYERKGLQLKNLSRTVEDAGTLTSPLVAWNSCGATMSASLGVATLHYLPWCFFNLLTPVMAIVLAATGWGMARKSLAKVG